jgi:hypothetical protein
MANTVFRHGDPVMIDYTPGGGNVALGDVVLLGTVTANTGGAGAIAAIAHHDITNSTLGALAIGGGVYDCVNLNNAAVGAKVYWDVAGATNKVTTVSTNNAVFGFIVKRGGAVANSTDRVMHAPAYGGN